MGKEFSRRCRKDARFDIRDIVVFEDAKNLNETAVEA